MKGFDTQDIFSSKKNPASFLLLSIGCVLAAFLFCIRFSFTTSFLYEGCHGTDSAIFYIIGKYWAQGSIPYVDLWDHKGPIVFFINCLGYLITNDKIGVLILQILSLSVFLFFTFITFRLRFSALVSSALSIISLFWLACSYEAGNLTEEYLLPYLAIAFYFTAKWLDRAEEGYLDHNPWQSFLLGFILGFSFLTRLTNALGACGIMLAVGGILLFQKEWKCFWKNVLFFCLGCVTIVVPFFLYFASKGALKEMLFGTFVYNFDFFLFISNNSLSEDNHYNYRDLLLFSILAANSLALATLSIISIFQNKAHRLSGFVWALSTLLLSAWLLSSSLNAHYRTLAVPYFPILVIEANRFREANKGKRLISIAVTIFLVLLFCGPVCMIAKKWNRFADYFYDSRTPIICDYVDRFVPTDERESFVGYSIPQGVYIDLDIKPCYHNFSLQETQAVKSLVLKEDILNEFGSLKADYILVSSEDVLIKDILTSYYLPLPPPEEIPHSRLWVKKNLGR